MQKQTSLLGVREPGGLEAAVTTSVGLTWDGVVSETARKTTCFCVDEVVSGKIKARLEMVKLY